MPFRLSITIACAALACLVAAPGAIAADEGIGVGTQRVAAAAEQPAAAARTATPSSLIAPVTACPGQGALSGPTAELEAAMLCMTNFARAQAGLGELAAAPELGQSARAKAEDVLSCDSFSHYACGRDFTYWIRAAGYIGGGCWHAGENLAWGTGEDGSVRSIFRAWMASPTHRRNILGAYEQVGIGLLSGNLEGRSGARVWASHFGSHC
jgi:uncharacterized protein YkwD